MARSLSDIALDIQRDYRSKGKAVYYAAAPYVDAMRVLDTLDGYYMHESAERVVITALINLGTWRGDTAQRVKRELRVMLHEHNPRHHKMPK